MKLPCRGGFVSCLLVRIAPRCVWDPRNSGALPAYLSSQTPVCLHLKPGKQLQPAWTTSWILKFTFSAGDKVALGSIRGTMCWNLSALHCSTCCYDQWECRGLLLFVEIRLLGLCSHGRNGMGAAIKSATMERKPVWWISVGKSEMTNIYRLSCQARIMFRRKERLPTHPYQLVDNGPPKTAWMSEDQTQSQQEPWASAALGYSWEIIVQRRSQENAKNFPNDPNYARSSTWCIHSNMGGIWITSAFSAALIDFNYISCCFSQECIAALLCVVTHFACWFSVSSCSSGVRDWTGEGLFSCCETLESRDKAGARETSLSFLWFTKKLESFLSVFK